MVAFTASITINYKCTWAAAENHVCTYSVIICVNGQMVMHSSSVNDSQVSMDSIEISILPKEHKNIQYLND